MGIAILLNLCYIMNMRIFRVIGQKEKDALEKSNNICRSQHACQRPDWLLNSRPDDYETGKFFFFEIEDVLKFAREKYFNKQCYLLELNIDKGLILPYLAYGVYVYPDYLESGRWSNQKYHYIPEVFLSYSIVDDILQSKKYILSQIDNRISTKFKAPYDKNRNQHVIKLGKILRKLCAAKNNYYRYSPDNEDCEYAKSDISRIKYYEEAKQELNTLETLFPTIFTDFLNNHRGYTTQLSDFKIIDKKQDVEEKTL